MGLPGFMMITSFQYTGLNQVLKIEKRRMFPMIGLVSDYVRAEANLQIGECILGRFILIQEIDNPLNVKNLSDGDSIECIMNAHCKT